MRVVLYVIAGAVLIVGGMGVIIGLAAVMISGECSEDERAAEFDGVLRRSDPPYWDAK
jgi:hypothetical protein